MLEIMVFINSLFVLIVELFLSQLQLLLDSIQKRFFLLHILLVSFKVTAEQAIAFSLFS